MSKSLNIKVDGAIPVHEIEAAIRFSGLRLSRHQDGSFCLEREHGQGHCDLCGCWAGELVQGACIPCNNSHNVQLSNQEYES